MHKTTENQQWFSHLSFTTMVAALCCHSCRI